MTRKAIVAVLLLGLCASAAMADTNKAMVEAAKKSQGAFVTVTVRIQNQVIVGQAVCIDPAGVFLTFALPGRIQTAMFEDVQVIPPGVGATPVPATILGIDPERPVAFLKAQAGAPWSAIQFAKASKLQVGQQVVSAGIMPGDPARGLALGSAYVSSEIRLPEMLYFVSGGSLTSVGSVVFADTGEAVGIVGPQPFQTFQMATERGPTDINLRPRQESEFFSPVEEYAHVIEARGDRKLPWIGVLDFTGVAPAEATPAGIFLGRVPKDQVGDKAGLKEGDLVVKVDDKPIEWLGNANLTVTHFTRKLLAKKPGAMVTLSIIREDAGKKETLTKSVKLEDMPELPHQANAFGSQELGLIAREKVMLDSYTLQGKASQPGGMVVEVVGMNTIAAVSGLLPGDVIREVNGKPIARADTLKAIVDEAMANPAKSILLLTVNRGDEVLPLSMRVPTIQPTTAPAR